jgi:hypothetical protein
VEHGALRTFIGATLNVWCMYLMLMGSTSRVSASGTAQWSQ